MDTLFKFLFDFLGQFFGSLWGAISGIFKGIYGAFNIPKYFEIINNYTTPLGGLAWVVGVIAILLLVGVLFLIVFFLIKGIKKFVKFKKKAKDTNDLVNEVNALNKEVMRLNLEKDKILSMKVSQIGLNPNEIAELTGEEMEALNKGEEEEEATGRFNKLVTIDEEWANYEPDPYDWDVTLPDFVTNFRNFACSRMHYWYEIKLLRCFVAGFASGRLTILQGISGTGKTSLPYAFGKFVQKDTTVVSVQPSWRERTELYGYFNEFTSKYTETEFLRSVYEANYIRDPNFIILDEMNIARVEYYFAEMLSILEMPIQTEWKIDIATAVWDNDPCLINEGKVSIPNNIWFIGTINNDDSTFAVADKVYDRAIPIDLDSRAEAFEIESEGSIHISTDRINELFDEAKINYGLSDEVMEKLEMMNEYLIKNFRLAFGNRIMKQLRDYVPCFIACGGTELEAVDFMVAKKVLRKFESLSLDFMRDELSNFIIYLDKMFGKSNMTICKEYIAYLRRVN